jgi:hypothetical protein
MIQRIQTLWLLAAVACGIALFWTPLLQAPSDDTARTVAVLADGALTATDNSALAGLSALSVLTALVAVFLFKNRPLQGRLAQAGVGIGILLLGLILLAVNMARAELPDEVQLRLTPALALPIAYAICCGLAARAIRRDEALVRSMDRLR